MWSQFLDKTEVGNTSSIVLSSLEMTCYSGEECLQHKLGFPYPSSLYGWGPLVERSKFYSNIFGCILTRNIMDMYVSCQKKVKFIFLSKRARLQFLQSDWFLGGVRIFLSLSTVTATFCSISEKKKSAIAKVIWEGEGRKNNYVINQLWVGLYSEKLPL